MMFARPFLAFSKLSVALVLTVFVTEQASLHAEDVKLRQRAVELLERANAISTVEKRSPYEQIVDFQVLNAMGDAPQEGHQKITWGGPMLVRAEDDFGKFHLVNIWNDNMLYLKGENADVVPTAFDQATRDLPIHLVRFDHEDTIRSIDAAVVGGRTSQCIEFDSKFGDQKQQRNEICVDGETGTMVRLQLGAIMEEYSDFVRFAGAYLPSKIYIYRNGRAMYHVQQTFTPIEGKPAPALFERPPGASARMKCAQMRRAFGRSMPQPALGNGQENTDITIAGMIGDDGHVYSAGITESDRPDLNEEALKLVSTWTFDPLLCDGKPGWQKETFVLHFQGR
jgi:hypothetical protein